MIVKIVNKKPHPMARASTIINMSNVVSIDEDDDKDSFRIKSINPCAWFEFSLKGVSLCIIKNNDWLEVGLHTLLMEWNASQS